MDGKNGATPKGMGLQRNNIKGKGMNRGKEERTPAVALAV